MSPAEEAEKKNDLKYNDEMFRKFVRETPDDATFTLKIGDCEFKGVKPYVGDLSPEDGRVYLEVEICVGPWEPEKKEEGK